MIFFQGVRNIYLKIIIIDELRQDTDAGGLISYQLASQSWHRRLACASAGFCKGLRLPKNAL
jgi:hypothetical protein